MHPRRPEWGAGTVKSALPITHEGQTAQRLTVDFANRGRVVINTAIATLTPPGSTQTMTQTAATSKGWLDQLESQNNGKQNELWDLPDALSDPFTTDAQQLDATLETYRYSTQPRALMDWAVAQTGLDDPLTKYTRPELEQAFPRYARDRDHHLLALVRKLKKQNDHAVLMLAKQNARHPEARNALERAMKR